MAQRRSAGGVVGSALLNLAAVGGLICIVLVLLSALLNVSLIMFKTGSMSPTIPAGSLAVVRQIPAPEIRVGDILTVDRPGMLPVTHRVTSVTGTGETRTITMRGDANEAPDPSPYTVTDARRVLASVPYLAHAVVWFSSPWVLGALTLGASALVTWAFWPRGPRQPREPREPREPKEPQTAGEQPDPGPRPESRGSGGPKHGTRSAAAGVVGCALLFGAIGAIAPGEGAWAATDAPVVLRGEHITLTSIGDRAAMLAMQPGIPVPWQVGVRVSGPDRGTVRVSLEAAGARALGLTLTVRECDVRWVGEQCAGRERVVGGHGPIEVAASPRLVTTLDAASERWFLMTATIAEPAEGTVALTLRAAGGSDAVAVNQGSEAARVPAGALGATGASGAWVLGVVSVACGLAVAGAATLTRGRRGGEAQ